MNVIQQALGSGVCQAFYNHLIAVGFRPDSASRYRKVLFELLNHSRLAEDEGRVDPKFELTELGKWAKGRSNCSRLGKFAELDSEAVGQLLQSLAGNLKSGYLRHVAPVATQIHSWLAGLRGLPVAAVPPIYPNLPPRVPYITAEQVETGIRELSGEFQRNQLRGKLAAALVYRVGVRPVAMSLVNRAAYDYDKKTLSLVVYGAEVHYPVDESTHVTLRAVLSERAVSCPPTTPLFAEYGEPFHRSHVDWYLRQLFRVLECPVGGQGCRSPIFTLWLLGAAHRIAREGCTTIAVSKEMQRHGLVSEEVRRQLIASARYFMPSRELKLPPQL